MRGIAGGLPKELLPVAGKPLLVHAIEGLAAGGIRQIAVVISPDKDCIRRVLLNEPGSCPAPRLDASARAILDSCRLTFFVQSVPLGLADAVSLCREFIDTDPFALLIPDNLLLDGPPVMVQMLPYFLRCPRDMIGALRLAPGECSRFGNVGVLQAESLPGREQGILRVSHFSAKQRGQLEAPASTGCLKCFGGGIYLPHYFDFIERLRPRAAGEVDDVPVVQAIIREKGLLAVVLEGKGFDVGNPEGYRAADLHAKRAAELQPGR
jgi:UTP--glucose-1-phosphate uridylyltransferase